MFGDIRDKLGTIDLVFDESLFERGNRMDERKKIDPAKKYTDKDRENLAERLCGIEARKVTGADAKHMLIGVRLEGEGQTYEAQFLRGFDIAPFSHAVIGMYFLNTLGDATREYFDVDRNWPEEGKGLHVHAVREIVYEKEGMKLKVTGIGGGKYNLIDGKLNVYGASRDFGPIPRSHQEQLRGLLGALVQKQPFKGYEVNMK